MDLLRTLSLVLISVGSVTGSVAGQEPLLDDWRWARFAVESGLPPGDFSRIAHSADGTNWVVTPLGLAWFDGFEWQYVLEESEGLRAISLVKPDHEGGVYIVSGGALFQGNRDGFQPVPMEFEGEPLPVSSLAVGPDRLFFLSRGELYQRADGQVTIIPLLGDLEAEPYSLYSHDGWILVWASGSVWRWKDGHWLRVFDYSPGARLRVAASGETLAIAELESGTGKSTVWVLDGGGDPVGRAAPRESPPLALAAADDGDVVVTFEGGTASVRRDGRWAPLDPVPPPLRSVQWIEFDTAGDLWAGSETGLYVNRGSLDRWTRWDSYVLSDGHFTANALAGQMNGDIWVGTNSGLLVRHSDGSTEGFSTILGRTLGPVTGLIEDREGNLWVSSGAKLDGVFRFDGTEWTHFGTEQGLLAPRVHRMALDREGRVWFLGMGLTVGGVQPGAFYFDGERFAPWGEQEGLIEGRVYAFAEGPDGARWFGTSGGLSRWLNGEWTHWTEEDGIRRGAVFTLAIGSDGTVWFGHGPRARGLGFLSGGQVQYLPSVDATENGRVWDIQPASDGSLWLGTRAGLARMTPDGIKFLGPSDGMEHQLVWSVLPLEDRVLAATVGGGVYGLSLASASDPQPRVRLEPAIVTADGVHLGWTALAYQGRTSPGDIDTRYRTDGGEWSDWGRVRELGPISISRGSHLFEVQARGLLGQPGEVVSQLFRLPPPFYLHPFFLAILGLWVLSAAGGGALFVRRRRRSVRKLREREAYFRSLIEHSSDLITVVTSDGSIRYQSPSSEAIIGYASAEWVGSPFLELIHPEDREAVSREVERGFAEPGVPRGGTARFRHKDERWRILESVSQVHVQADEEPLAVINARDVTERVESEEERERLAQDLRNSRDRLKDLTARMETVRGEERRRLARELHDDVGQNLTAMRWDLHQVLKDSLDGPADITDRLHSMIGIVEDSIVRVNRLSHELRSPVLEFLGLEAAVEAHAKEIQERTGIEMGLALHLGELESHDQRDTSILNFFQEAISNVVRHARASRIEVGLRAEGEELVLEVLDDGIGITDDQLQDRRSFGLMRMQERIERLGGKVTVQRRDEGGTRVRAEIPVVAENC